MMKQKGTVKWQQYQKLKGFDHKMLKFPRFLTWYFQKSLYFCEENGKV